MRSFRSLVQEEHEREFNGQNLAVLDEPSEEKAAYMAGQLGNARLVTMAIECGLAEAAWQGFQMCTDTGWLVTHPILEVFEEHAPQILRNHDFQIACKSVHAWLDAHKHPARVPMNRRTKFGRCTMPGESSMTVGALPTFIDID